MLFWFGGGIGDKEASKKSACNAGDTQEMQVQPLGQKYPLKEKNGNPLQYSYLENPHVQRSLAGHRLWGHQESDMTKWLSTAQAPYQNIYGSGWENWTSFSKVERMEKRKEKRAEEIKSSPNTQARYREMIEKKRLIFLSLSMAVEPLFSPHPLPHHCQVQE